MIPPEYRGHNPGTRAWSREMAEFLDRLQSEVEGLRVEMGQRPSGHPATGSAYVPRFRLHTETTTGSNITIGQESLNMVHYVKNTAAIDFTLPEMDPGDWVIVVNDSGSTNDVTVKDKDANTISTVTVGNSSGDIMVDISGVEAPL